MDGYLYHEISPLTIQKHVDVPANFCHQFVPDSGKAQLVPRGKTVNFIEPQTGEQICDGNMLLYNNTSFGNICRMFNELSKF